MRDVAELIVCEPDGRWAMRLGRRLGTQRIRIRQTGSLGECRGALELARSSVVVVELTPSNPAEVIDFVASVWRSFAGAVVLVVAGPGMADFRELAVEAGAAALVTSPRELAGVVQMIYAHLHRVVTAPVTTAEQIMDSLPWSDGAM